MTIKLFKPAAHEMEARPKPGEFRGYTPESLPVPFVNNEVPVMPKFRSTGADISYFAGGADPRPRSNEPMDVDGSMSLIPRGFDTHWTSCDEAPATPFTIKK